MNKVVSISNRIINSIINDIDIVLNEGIGININADFIVGDGRYIIIIPDKVVIPVDRIL